MNKLKATFVASLLILCSIAFLPKSTAQQDTKTVSIAGLKDRVTIRRDERGIPYIEATNDDDLYFAQGYVTGSDRLCRWIFCGATSAANWQKIFAPGRWAKVSDIAPLAWPQAGRKAQRPCAQ